MINWLKKVQWKKFFLMKAIEISTIIMAYLFVVYIIRPDDHMDWFLWGVIMGIVWASAMNAIHTEIIYKKNEGA